MTAGWTRRHLLIAAGAAALVGSPRALLAATPRLYRWRGTALGGSATMLLDAGGQARGEALAAECLAEIGRLEAIFSLYRRDSAICRLNAEQRLADPPHELLEVLSLSRQLWQDSGGAFDPTVQPVWQAHAQQADDAVRARARASVGFGRVRLSTREIAFTAPGMALTLNGIAQGYITDRVAALLRGRGLGHTLIQLGETRALGPRPDGPAWQVSIETPAAPGHAVDHIALDGMALAVSSGQGTILADANNHLLDPRTGESPHDARTVAVRAPTAVLADGLSTALAVLPREAAAGLLRQHPGVTGWVVDARGGATAVKA